MLQDATSDGKVAITYESLADSDIEECAVVTTFLDNICTGKGTPV